MEKSELWVYKGQGPDEAMDGASGENEHKKTEVGDTQVRLLEEMCGLLGTSERPPLVSGKNADARMGWDLKWSACYLDDSHSSRK